MYNDVYKKKTSIQQLTVNFHYCYQHLQLVNRQEFTNQESGRQLLLSIAQGHCRQHHQIFNCPPLVRVFSCTQGLLIQ